MKKRMAVVLACILWGALAEAAHMERVYIPATQKSALWTSAIPKNVLQQMMDLGCPRFTLDAFSGKSSALEAEDGPASRRVAIEWPCNLASETLLGAAIDDGEGQTFLMEVQSLDASAIRLRVDLSTLAPGQSVYAAAPDNLLAFGPYTAANGVCWLDPVPGDTCVLVASSPDDSLPRFALTAIAHFYRDMEKALYSCPINAACVEDDSYQQVSTAVGQLLIPITGDGQYTCTGTLLANAANGENQPYFLSAHHCFDGDVDVPGIVVFWDYRAADCDGGDVPDLWDPSQVPRSAGMALLANDACLDGEFIELDSAPVGTLGRAWAGWETRDLENGDEVALAHYPMGSAMKAAFGNVEDTNVRGCLDYMCLSPVYHQTLVQWDEGITQGGSSGSPLLRVEGDYCVTGMLSNGPVHNCDTPEENVDNFATFSRFHDQIACYLEEDATCEGPMDCGGLCPAKAVFDPDGAMVSGLRAFRDKILSKSETGRQLIAQYYTISPSWSATLQQSNEAKGLFSIIAIPAAWLGAVVEGK